MLAGLLAAPAAALAEPCDASDAEGAEQVVTTPKPSGYDVTEVYGEGVYRVSRCDRSGDLIEGQTVAPIMEPDGDVALVPSTYSSPAGDGSVLYGDPTRPGVGARVGGGAASTSRTRSSPPPRGVDVDVPEDLPRTAARRRVRVRGPAGGRGAGQRRLPQRRLRALRRHRPLAGAPLHLPHQRALVRRNAATRRSIVAGHKTWNDTRDDCGFRDQPNIVAGYVGRTSRTARSRADGLNVIDRGEIANIARCGNSKVVLACSWVQPGQERGPYTENDQRYDDDYTFTNAGIVGGAYDYWHVATHESGHSLGLDHSTASPWLTMYPQVVQSSTFWRTLALGDVFGMRNIYP